MNARRWVPLLIGLIAIMLLVYGAYAFLAELRSTREEPSGAGTQRPMIAGKKRPKDYGLPEFPTAHAFRSADDGTPDHGSAAFDVRRGTAKEVAAFYRKELPALGWSFTGEKPSKQQPGTGAVPNPPTVTGVRQSWTEKNGKRKLTVLALDFIQLKSTAQVALSWSPVLEAPPARP